MAVPTIHPPNAPQPAALHHLPHRGLADMQRQGDGLPADFYILQPNRINNTTMNELLTFGLLAFTSFFTLINPLGTMTIFMTMTASLSERARKHTARKATIASLITIVAFAFSGQLLFKFFGISVDSFRVVGGVIFFIMGLDMLNARLVKIKVKSSEVKTYVNDISITPLAIPMICGPGAITNAIVLMEDASTIWHKLILMGALMLVMLLTYIILYSSSRLLKLLGETGNNVMMRLMGLIVMVIAVEFFFSGISPFVVNMLRAGTLAH